MKKKFNCKLLILINFIAENNNFVQLINIFLKPYFIAMHHESWINHIKKERKYNKFNNKVENSTYIGV